MSKNLTNEDHPETIQVKKLEEIVPVLERLGLPTEEALVYCHLTLKGPSRAGALAAATRLSRPQTYRALEGLTERGLVASDLGRPRGFLARDVDHLIQYLRTHRENQLRELQSFEPELVKSLSGPAPIRAAQDEKRFDLLRGRGPIINRAQELYAKAKKEIIVFITHPEGAELLRSTGSLSRMLERVPGSVKIRLVLRAGSPTPQELRELARRPGVEVRHIETDRAMGCVVTDRRDALVVLETEVGRGNNDGPVALTTNAPSLVEFLLLSLEALWDNGTPFQA